MPKRPLFYSVVELKTLEDSMRFAHLPVNQLRLDVARALRRARAAAREQLTGSAS